jgi:hypothetical protein
MMFALFHCSLFIAAYFKQKLNFSFRISFKSICNPDSKEHCHEIFDFRFDFSWIILLQVPDNPIRVFLIFLQKVVKMQLKVNHRCQKQRRRIYHRCHWYRRQI